MATKLSVWQMTTVGAAIGCGVLGFVSLVAFGRAQNLQAKLTKADQELEIVRKIPGFTQLVNSSARLRQEKPEVYKQAQQMIEQAPQRIRQSHEAEVQERLVKVQDRLKTTQAGGEIMVLRRIEEALTALREVETTVADPTARLEGLPARAGERIALNQALARLREQYIEVRLQMLVRELGNTDSATIDKFVSGTQQLLADTDAMIVPSWARWLNAASANRKKP